MTKPSADYWLGRALAAIDYAARVVSAIKGATPFDAGLLASVAAKMEAERKEIWEGWTEDLPAADKDAAP